MALEVVRPTRTASTIAAAWVATRSVANFGPGVDTREATSIEPVALREVAIPILPPLALVDHVKQALAASSHVLALPTRKCSGAAVPVGVRAAAATLPSHGLAVVTATLLSPDQQNRRNGDTRRGHS